MRSATVSDRLKITHPRKVAADSSFARDVDRGLSASPKTLSSKYLYDQVGSALFDAITVLPEYYLTRAETAVLREWGWEMVRSIGNPIEFLELGSGSAVKTRLLIEEALRVQRALRYSAIDISTDALEASARALVAAYDGLTVHAYSGDYFALLENGKFEREQRVLAMFMGSNIGNYEPAQAKRLMTLLGSALRSGDGLLLGADLKKDPAVLQLAYDDPAGVTAAFTKNVLGRINRELGGTFDLRDFRHVAEYDEARGAVDSFLVALEARTVRIAALNRDVAFAPGERIHVESSYKFSLEDLARLAAGAGFELSRTWTDREERFSVNLLVRP
jgi:dimethylhistidine N-methyltransferase